MTALSCTKRKNSRIFLQVCITTDCKLRDKCTSYAAIDAAAEASAISDVQAHHHHATVPPMPLLEQQGAAHA